MLPGISAMAMMSAAAIFAAYINSYTSTASSTSYTFASCDIGIPDAKRYVVVAVSSGGGPNPVTSCTVAGAATTKVASNTDNSAIFISTNPVTSGTTANIVVSIPAGAVGSCVINVYTITGNISLTPSGTLDIVRAGSTQIGNNNITVAQNGIVIAISRNNDGAATCTWTNANEVYDSIVGTNGYSGAVISGLPSGTLSLGTTWSTSSSAKICAVAIAPL